VPFVAFVFGAGASGSFAVLFLVAMMSAGKASPGGESSVPSPDAPPERPAGPPRGAPGSARTGRGLLTCAPVPSP
jgi:hypothetical protein